MKTNAKETLKAYPYLTKDLAKAAGLTEASFAPWKAKHSKELKAIKDGAVTDPENYHRKRFNEEFMTRIISLRDGKGKSTKSAAATSTKTVKKVTRKRRTTQAGAGSDYLIVKVPSDQLVTFNSIAKLMDLKISELPL